LPRFGVGSVSVLLPVRWRRRDIDVSRGRAAIHHFARESCPSANGQRV